LTDGPSRPAPESPSARTRTNRSGILQRGQGDPTNAGVLSFQPKEHHMAKSAKKTAKKAKKTATAKVQPKGRGK